ncbi:MAG TPA: TolC family protein, partial [Candidatus Omnitrophota bacterium]|nr:TolC family protein [Candidatus Omnitrophota bacterium]
KNNPELISSLAVLDQSKASKSITQSALFPQINANVGASTSKTGKGETSSTATPGTRDTYSYGVTRSQLVFDGMQTINNVRGAQEDVKASKEAYRFTSASIRFSLRSAFITLLRAQDLIKVTEDIVRIRRDNLILITLRYESGLEHKGALLTAEANMAQASYEFEQAKRNLDFAQWQLLKEMGRDKFEQISVIGDFSVVDTAKEKPNFDDIVEKNPSVLEAVAQKNSASFGISSAKGAFLPEITGAASADRSGSHWPPQTSGWSAGLDLNMPIFEGGLKFAQLDQAKALYEQRKADEKDIRNSAYVALEQRWADLRDALENVDVSKKSLLATEERSKIAQAQYSTGFIGFDDWIIIENDLVSAKKSYLDSQASALLAEANWILAKGETLEYAK